MRISLLFSYLLPAHSPDNSFMGFVVASLSNDTHGESPPERLNQALVYGKSDTMWKVFGIEKFMSAMAHIPTYPLVHA